MTSDHPEDSDLLDCLSQASLVTAALQAMVASAVEQVSTRLAVHISIIRCAAQTSIDDIIS